MKPGSQYYHLLNNVRKLAKGEAFVAAKGIDFTCQPQSFQGVVYDLAKTKGRGWIGTSTVIGGSVVYAFYMRSDLMRPNLPAYPIVKKMRGEK